MTDTECVTPSGFRISRRWAHTSCRTTPMHIIPSDIWREIGFLQQRNLFGTNLSGFFFFSLQGRRKTGLNSSLPEQTQSCWAAISLWGLTIVTGRSNFQEGGVSELHTDH